MLDSDNFQKLREVFQSIDKNGDGFLSPSEIKQAVEKYDFQIDSKELISQIDSDKNGLINYSEFLTATVDKSSAYSKLRLQQAFQKFDKNGDGKISLSELKSTLGGEGKNDSIFTAMISEADTNHDGLIDFDEFIAHMTKYAENNL